MKKLITTILCLILSTCFCGQASDVESVNAIETLNYEPATTYYNVPLSDDLQEWIYQLCDLYKVDIKMVYAMIKVESDFQSKAVNPQGNCFGLMQIHECNKKWLEYEIGKGDFLDPYYNVKCGIYYIAKLQQSFDENVKGMLRFYSGTKDDFYVDKVFNELKGIKER